MTTAPIESIFSRAWQLLTRNWVIIVPGIVIGVIIGVASAIPASFGQAAVGSDGTFHPGAAMGAISTGFIVGIIGVLGFIATQAYTVGMAGAAWQRGTTTLADGSAAFAESAGNILVTAVGLIVLGFVAFVLSIPTLGLAFIAYVLFTLYAMPASIIGKRPGFSSITESFRIATQRFVPTLIIAVLIGVISFVVGLITLPLHFVPFLGTIVAAVLTQMVVAYGVLVVVGEYLALRSLPPPGTSSGAYATGADLTGAPPTDPYTPPPPNV